MTNARWTGTGAQVCALAAMFAMGAPLTSGCAKGLTSSPGEGGGGAGGEGGATSSSASASSSGASSSSSSSSGAAMGGEGGGVDLCPGATDCNGHCVDTANDPANCGACDHACEPGEACSAGTCGVDCPGATNCNGHCTDTSNDPKNCGACAQACSPGDVCSGGLCGLVCLGGTIKCVDHCVDAKNDPKNCGVCGHACAPGEACANGQCGFCLPGFTQCNATCVDLQSDPTSCGGCNVVCQAPQVCSMGACADTCGGGLTACGQTCLDTQADPANCGSCGHACAPGEGCAAGACTSCDSATTDCDGDGWLVADGDCCDRPGLCGAQPELVNPGAIEVVGNGLDDNCNGKTDLFDAEDTVSCDAALPSDSQDPIDYARALGICRQAQEHPILPKDRTWGLIDAQLLRADGSPLAYFGAVSIRPTFGSIAPGTTEGQSVMVMSSGVAADATQTTPGPNHGAPAGVNVSTSHLPISMVDLAGAGQTHSVNDWYMTPNMPLKAAGGLPNSPGCAAGSAPKAEDSAMLYLRMRAPTNAKAFSFNSYFFSSEYPEFVCTPFNDQFIALVDTPSGTPSPIANPVDKNLMTYTQGGSQWPIGINIAKGTSLFSVCDSQAQSPGCWSPDVSGTSCSLGSAQLAGTGFEASQGQACTIGGGTFWLTTAGNVIPGEIVELRIAIWDVGDSAYDSLAVIDGFQWLTSATLPGTGN